MGMGTGRDGNIGIGMAARRGLRALLLLALGAAVLGAPRVARASGAAPPSEPKRVLALFDFGKDAPANVTWDRAIRETLEGARPGAVEYYAEFFDAARFTDEGHV